MKYNQLAEAAFKIFGFKVLRWPDGTRYLTRFIVFRCSRGLRYLHRIHRHDPDRHVHNHPWPAKCYVLWGGYTEVVQNRFSGYQLRRTYRRGDVNELRENEYHRIVDVLPNTWTWVVGGRRYRRWGFLVNGQPVDADVYLSRTN